jgi:hypothetical protein
MRRCQAHTGAEDAVEGAMAKWYEAVNHASFKPTAEGYVFQSPNPWLFGWPRYYLVNEAQRAAILPCMGRWRLLLLLTVLAEMLILGALVAFVKLAPTTFFRLVAPAFQWGVGVFATIVFVGMLLVMVPLILLPQLYLNRSLAPLLATAPRTSQRIVMSDQLPRIAGLVSGKVLALGLFGGICLMGAAAAGLVDGYFEGRWMGALLWPFLPTFALGAAVTSYFAYLFRLRSGQRRAAKIT